MNDYKKLHKDLNHYGNLLNNINESDKTPNNIRDISFNVVRIVGSLKDKREKEKLFFIDIKNKYGEGTFNPTTFEYVLKS